MAFLFIIGQHRTGSTLLKNILDANSSITMVFDEMNLYEPFRKNTLDRLIDNKNLSAGEIVQIIQNKQVYGTFWKEFEQSGITYSELEKELSGEDEINSANVIKAVLNLLSRNFNTLISGVKYPVHMSHVSFLLKYWPQAKFLFLTRNPKAIIASKLKDKATLERKKKSFMHRILIHYFTIFYFVMEYRKSIKIYFAKREKLQLVTYESLIKHPKSVIENICNMLGVSYDEDMLLVTGKTSSHHNKPRNSLDTQSLAKYKDSLSKFDLMLISLLTDNFYNKIRDELAIDF